MPIFSDSGLDQLKVGLGDRPFPDGNGRHSHCISEMNRRRQQKMHGNEKILNRGGFCGKLARIVG